MVQIDPTALTVLDVSPYNRVSIACIATQPEAVNISKAINWSRVSPDGVAQMLNHDGVGINISTVSIESSVSSSRLSVYATTVGRWTYMCTASLQVPSDPLILYSQTAEVTAKGEQESDRHC